MRNILIVLALTLLIAGAASAQSAAPSKHWRYDPARPHSYYRVYDHRPLGGYSNRHGRHHHHNGRNDHGRDSYRPLGGSGTSRGSGRPPQA
jgi:hypothetical protein